MRQLMWTDSQIVVLVRCAARRVVGLAIAVAGCQSDDGGRVGDAGTSEATLATGSSGTDDASTRSDADDSVGDAGDTTGSDDTITAGQGTTTDDVGSTDDGNESGGAAMCGDGSRDLGEPCDDGNRIEADGCNTDCTVSGSVLWSHSTAGGVDQHEDGHGVAVAADEAAFVAGDLVATTRDLFLRGYTPEGGLAFTTITDGASAGDDGWRAVAVSGDTLYAAGQYTTAGGSDVLVASFGTDGSGGWSSGYDDPLGGTDIAHAVTVDLEGNVVIAGAATADLEGVNVLVQKLTPAGAVSWTQFYTSAGAVTDQARGVVTDFAANVIAVGFETAGQADVWVRKYDPAGTTLWTRGFAGADGLDDQANAVAAAPNGDLVVVGRESTAAVSALLWLRRYDLNGNEAWTQTYAGSAGEGAEGLGVVIDAAGDITAVGREVFGGVDRVLVRKYSADGSVRWSEAIDGAEGTSSIGRAITTGPDGHLWIAGGIDKGVDGRDVYIAKVAR